MDSIANGRRMLGSQPPGGSMVGLPGQRAINRLEPARTTAPNGPWLRASCPGRNQAATLKTKNIKGMGYGIKSDRVG